MADKPGSLAWNPVLSDDAALLQVVTTLSLLVQNFLKAEDPQSQLLASALQTVSSLLETDKEKAALVASELFGAQLTASRLREVISHVTDGQPLKEAQPKRRDVLARLSKTKAVIKPVEIGKPEEEPGERPKPARLRKKPRRLSADLEPSPSNDRSPRRKTAPVHQPSPDSPANSEDSASDSDGETTPTLTTDRSTASLPEPVLNTRKRKAPASETPEGTLNKKSADNQTKWLEILRTSPSSVAANRSQLEEYVSKGHNFDTLGECHYKLRDAIGRLYDGETTSAVAKLEHLIIFRVAAAVGGLFVAWKGLQSKMTNVVGFDILDAVHGTEIKLWTRRLCGGMERGAYLIVGSEGLSVYQVHRLITTKGHLENVVQELYPDDSRKDMEELVDKITSLFVDEYVKITTRTYDVCKLWDEDQHGELTVELLTDQMRTMIDRHIPRRYSSLRTSWPLA